MIPGFTVLTVLSLTHDLSGMSITNDLRAFLHEFKYIFPALFYVSLAKKVALKKFLNRPAFEGGRGISLRMTGRRSAPSTPISPVIIGDSNQHPSARCARCLSGKSE
jgi:hypothetical protein